LDSGGGERERRGERFGVHCVDSFQCGGLEEVGA